MNTPVFVSGISAIGPGFKDWPQLAAILRGESAWNAQPTEAPALSLLPPAERRRVGMLVKLALVSGMQAVEQAGADARQLPTVFTASGGDGENCHILCATLASDDRSISPTRFHNSVHNAASGYWSIATGCMESSTSLCAHDAGFAAGLIEAHTQVRASGKPCLLIACDDPYGGALGMARPIAERMAVALLLTPARQASSLASLSIALGDDAPDPAPLPALQDIQDGIPAARALPLLHRLATAQPGHAALAYLDPLCLKVTVETLPSA